MTKTKKKKKKNTFIQTLKDYQIIIIYLNSILSFLAILISVINTNITKKDNNFNHNEVAPAFQINTYEQDNEIIAELVNLKGFINNVNFTRYDEIKVLSPYIDFNVTIDCSHFIGKTEENKWLINWSCRNDFGEKVAKKVYELAKEKGIELSNSYSFTYYKIEYQDFKNEFHTEVYYKNLDGILKLQTNIKEYKFGIHTGMPENREVNDRQIEYQAKHILEYLENYKNIYYNN